MEAMRDPGYRDPVARLAAMDRDGVEAEVLYSEVSAFRAYGLVQGDWRPISRAFTDLLVEFAAHDPNRLAVSYQVPIIDIPYAVSEVERLASVGARSVHLPNWPSELGLPDYHEPVYDPLWSVLQETGISISHHLGNRASLWEVFRRDPTKQAAIFTSLPALALSEVIAWWIMTGTLERFPTLKIAYSEGQVGWMPYVMERADKLAAERAANSFGTSLPQPPSSYVSRIYGCIFDDEIGLANRDVIGMDQICFETDYPHADSTFPKSKEVAEEICAKAGLDDEEIYKFIRGNAIKAFGLERFGITR